MTTLPTTTPATPAAAPTPPPVLLSEQERADLIESLTDKQRVFYTALVRASYNTTAAARVATGQEEATNRHGAHYRHVPAIAALVADDFARLHMSADEARAHLAAVARNADLRLFLRAEEHPQFGTIVRLDPEAILLFGDGIREYEEEETIGPNGRPRLRRKIRLHDRPRVLDKVAQVAPCAAGEALPGGDLHATFFTQIHNHITAAAPVAGIPITPHADVSEAVQALPKGRARGRRKNG